MASPCDEVIGNPGAVDQALEMGDPPPPQPAAAPPSGNVDLMVSGKDEDVQDNPSARMVASEDDKAEKRQVGMFLMYCGVLVGVALLVPGILVLPDQGVEGTCTAPQTASHSCETTGCGKGCTAIYAELHEGFIVVAGENKSCSKLQLETSETALTGDCDASANKMKGGEPRACTQLNDGHCFVKGAAPAEATTALALLISGGCLLCLGCFCGIGCMMGKL
eukprot:TRINITY_DN43390_c0_g1_i1.p1 TRINITY_DN43390_c0_g1~~TRINITY_DN43390_c0_g1_i1.p1  ORF type:complete len:221 (-),score=34.51 TRINITY_DN43390_c0_g1_i1:217-879(-)